MRYLILLFVLFSSVGHATTTQEVMLLKDYLRIALANDDRDKAQTLRQAIAVRTDLLTKNNMAGVSRFIIVNVNEQRVRLVHHDMVLFDEKVVVGRVGMETPTFEDQIEDIVFNPVWNIPPDLAADMLPKMQAVGGWNGYKVYVDGQLVDSVDDVDLGMNYRIVQDPSETNALGTLKFNLPNMYGVYLHDTTSRHLFDEDNRQFSAGCVRVQNAESLAAKLLKWENEAIFSTIDEQTTMSIPLPTPVKVIIVDWKVYFDDSGKVVYN